MIRPTLLILPVEIRVKIYALLVLSTTPFSVDRDYDDPPSLVSLMCWTRCYRGCNPNPPLPLFLQTCWQIYDEAIDIHRSHRYVHVGIPVTSSWISWYPSSTLYDNPPAFNNMCRRNRYNTFEKIKLSSDDIPADLKTCKNMVIHLFKWGPNKSENLRMAMTTMRDFLGALNVEKVHVHLGRMNAEIYDKGLNVHDEELPPQLQEYLEEIPGLKMFCIMDHKLTQNSLRVTDLRGPQQRVPKS